MSLAGKTLFITGASRGIGLAIALRAARDGARIAIAAKTATPHPKLPGTVYSAAEEVERAGGKALPLIVDVRDEASVAAAVKRCAETFGGIDICINNASAINLAPTEQIDMRRYDLIQQINTRGTFVTTRACLPYLKQAANPPRPHPRTAAEPEAAVVRTAPRVFDLQVRHVAVHARDGGRIPRRGHRLQRPVAAHHGRDRGGGIRTRRHRHDAAFAPAARSWPTPRT